MRAGARADKAATARARAEAEAEESIEAHEASIRELENQIAADESAIARVDAADDSLSKDLALL